MKKDCVRKKIREWFGKDGSIVCEKKQSVTKVRNVEGERTALVEREFESEDVRVKKKRKVRE